LKMGAKVEREGASRVEAPKAPRVVACGVRVSPSPEGEWSEKGAVLPPQKIFLRFWDQMAYFRGLLLLNFVFFYDQNSTEIHLENKDCQGD